MIIAIDGPAGAGKSTIAKNIASILNITYIDTGAMYRAVTLKCLREKITENNKEEIENILNNTKIEFREQKIFLDGNNVEEEIRSVAVTKLVSEISAIHIVRQKLVEQQREIAKYQDCVMDGRDIGTIVFPDANFKFFLVADVEIRAKRRLIENESKGIYMSFEDLVADILRRDKYDSTRAIAPLIMAQDAILIDTGNKSIQEVTEEIIQHIQERTYEII